SADTMTAIVQDLLLLAKSDEGRLELRKTCVPLVTIVDEAVLLARRPDHASIERDIPAELDVFADPPLLNRVLVNLLSNAVRHTPAEGTVRIVASEAGCATSIVVSDSGEGIPPEHLARIFDRFHRVDTARDRESGGTGLGLAIAKSIVEAHHGRISLASELGKGTTVTISLPSPPLEERI
ncbi:MAG TPA: ATP-binding protein, partial [Fimbriimonas sp.]